MGKEGEGEGRDCIAQVLMRNEISYTVLMRLPASQVSDSDSHLVTPFNSTTHLWPHTPSLPRSSGPTIQKDREVEGVQILK